jgi:hypothetical protein
MTNVQTIRFHMPLANVSRDSVYRQRLTITGIDPDAAEKILNDLWTVDWTPVTSGIDWAIVDVKFLDSQYRPL